MGINLHPCPRGGVNSLFQAARARARGYRNTGTFITMIYMIASPAGSILPGTLMTGEDAALPTGDCLLSLALHGS